MKRILFVLHLPPPVHGSSIVGEFIKNSITVNREFNAQYINLGTSKSIGEIGQGGFKKILIYLKILCSLIYQLIFNRPNLVYLAITAKGVAFYKDMLVVFLVKILGVKLVLHFHNKGVSLNHHRGLDNLLYRFAFKNTKVILLSKYLFYDVEKYVKPDDVYYCPNGVPDISLIESSLPNKGNDSVVNLLFLSNLIQSKGVLILLEACSILKERGLKFFCTFIGGEGDVSRERFGKTINILGINDFVVYEGGKYGKDKELAFSRAGLFVFPTINDCFPLVLLEAMQYSLPIISTYEGGIPDIITNNENGYLIEKHSSQALADKLEELIVNPELRRKLGRNGRRLYEQKFRLDKFEKNFITILKKLTEQ